MQGITAKSNDEVAAEGFGVMEMTEMDEWMSKFEGECSSDFEKQVREEVQPGYHKTTQFAFLDVTPYCRDAMSAIVQDTFTQCFESKQQTPWDFSFYLMPMSYFSWVIRHFILFPIRCCILLGGLWLFAAMIAASYCFRKERAQEIKLLAIKVLANGLLFSWCAVVIEEGTRPARKPGQIYVSNHSTVIDIVLLLKNQPLSLTGQKQSGLIGFFQNYVLDVMENMWFDRPVLILKERRGEQKKGKKERFYRIGFFGRNKGGDDYLIPWLTSLQPLLSDIDDAGLFNTNRLASKDRSYVAKRIKEHVADVSKPPLLVFPEGTCVNNEHIVMFKRGAFQLGTSIVPVAIKYNKIFVDGYWNSRKESFQTHLFRLMTAWALVVEVKYLDQQTKRKDETATAFASRVKAMIAKSAGLNQVPWDGYLKYYKPRPEYLNTRKQTYAKMLRQRFSLVSPTSSPEAGKKKLEQQQQHSSPQHKHSTDAEKENVVSPLKSVLSPSSGSLQHRRSKTESSSSN